MFLRNASQTGDGPMHSDLHVLSGLPAVDVIIPCYNRESTVREAVESVLAQDYPDMKVHVIDDGSTDGSLDVLHAIKDPRLAIHVNKGRKGVSGARNFGVRQGCASWIAFQDSDDLWLPTKLRKQIVRALDRTNIAVYCGMVVKSDFHPNTPVSSRLPPTRIEHLEGDILPSLTFESFVSTQTLIIKRDVFDIVGGFDETLEALVDWDLMLRVAQQGWTAFVNEDLVIQRFSDNSITRSSDKRLRSQEAILNKHRSLLKRYPAAYEFHYRRIAGGHRRAGNWDAAIAATQRTVDLSPFSVQNRLRLIFLRLARLACE